MNTGAPTPGRPISRRRFLGLAGVLAAGGVAVGALELSRQAAGPANPSASTPATATAGATPGTAAAVPSPSPTPGPRRHFRSRPDLTPPLLSVTTRVGTLAPGLIFLTPANGTTQNGPTIIDDTGELVWMRPDTSGYATNLKVASYQGLPVLTWWQGANNAGIGSGEHVVVDAAYREVIRIRGASGRQADLHELQLTAGGTALITADAAITMPPASGATPTTPAPAEVMDCAIQEVDLATGRLMFEWHSTDHVGLDESIADVPKDSGSVYDYFHANSIDVDTDGDLIVSARNTSAIYKIDRQTGQIRWRLGGKRSDFAMGPGTSFALQHDARRQPDGTITIFDDNQAPGHSRAIALRLDESAMTATLVREYPQPQGLLATSQGNVQMLPNGNVFVGWGALPRFSEFDVTGRLLYDATFTATQSYRDYRFPWVGLPDDLPAIAVDGSAGSLTVYASWNGATEIAAWEVVAGKDAKHLEVSGSASRTGFETVIAVKTTAAFVAVRALDASGSILGTSPVVSLTT